MASGTSMRPSRTVLDRLAGAPTPISIEQDLRRGAY